jgi:zeaxanthin glucosyltransferase
MAHFGIVTPPVSGHIHPFAALGRTLIARGHRVTCFQVLDLEPSIRAEGLEFHPIGATDHPKGSLPASLAQLARLKGYPALRFTVQAVEKTTRMVCRDVPGAIGASGVDALLVDQMEPAGGAIAEHLGLPFVTVCNALAINRDDTVPPPFSPWRYSDRWWARARNMIGYAVSERVTAPVARAVAEYRRHCGLTPWRSQEESFSPLAQICQMPREFDFPRRTLPESFHYVGPLRSPRPHPTPFPWEQLDGRPLVYASLGTLQNTREPLFRCFAEACVGMDVQLVISHGGGLSDRAAASLPESPLVVTFAPQVELLARAALTITHAGLNTVLDSLANGTPIVAIPLTYEQPAIARRVEESRSGAVIALRKLTPERLRRTVRAVLQDDSYRAHASRMAEAIQTAGGVFRAALLVEAATLGEATTAR